MTKDYYQQHNVEGTHDSLTFYGGEPSTVFAWHTEEHDLYGINYLDWGAPKVWGW